MHLAVDEHRLIRWRCSAQVRELGDMAAKFGVEKTPALLMVCNGNPATAERYEGEIKSGPIREFISKYAGGRKCASAVKVRSTDDVQPTIPDLCILFWQ